MHLASLYPLMLEEHYYVLRLTAMAGNKDCQKDGEMKKFLHLISAPNREIYYGHL